MSMLLLLPVRLRHSVQIPPCMGTRNDKSFSLSSFVVTFAIFPSSSQRTLTVLLANWRTSSLSHVTSSQWSVMMAPHSIPVAQVVSTRVPRRKKTLGWTLQFHPVSSSGSVESMSSMRRSYSWSRFSLMMVGVFWLG